MTPEHRFCEACGAPLTPGVRFCEECGSRVAVAPTAVPPRTPPAVPPPVVPADRPIAVIPFAYTQAGIFSVAHCTLVIYPDQVVVAYVPRARAAEMDRAKRDIEAALVEDEADPRASWELAAGAGLAVPSRRETGTSLPWEAYVAMPPGAALAEDPRNRAVRRDAIVYVRGESDGDTGTDQVLIRSQDGLQTVYFELGTFFVARKALLSLLMPGTGDREPVLGLLPWGSETQVDGFGFQYGWNLVVTDRRIVFNMIEDAFADESDVWLRAREEEAKAAGREWRDLDEAGRPGSPWQRLAGRPIPELLSSDVNFFIPLHAIGAVEVVPRARRHADEVRFILPGEVLTFALPEGSAARARSVLERAVPGRVR